MGSKLGKQLWVSLLRRVPGKAMPYPAIAACLDRICKVLERWCMHHAGLVFGITFDTLDLAPL